MYVNIVIYSNELLLFAWSTLKKEKKQKRVFHCAALLFHLCMATASLPLLTSRSLPSNHQRQ